MTPVAVVSLPHNFMGELYNEGEGPSFCHYDHGEERRPTSRGGEWATLPIPMPKYLTLNTDDTGRVIAAWADGVRIRWADLDIVTRGVEQYNRDIADAEDRPP